MNSEGGKAREASLISGFHHRHDKSTFIEIIFSGGCPWKNIFPSSLSQDCGDPRGHRWAYSKILFLFVVG